MRIRNAYVISLAFFVAACGGGGGESSSSNSTPQPAPAPTPVTVSVAGTSGDMTKYSATWIGECGTTLVNKRSTRQNFTLNKITGSKIEGSLQTWEYASYDCSGNVSLGYPITNSVTIEYLGNAAIDYTEISVSNPKRFLGSADRVRIVSSSGTSSSTQDFYLTFKDQHSKFMVSSNGTYSSLNINYMKSSN